MSRKDRGVLLVTWVLAFMCGLAAHQVLIYGDLEAASQKLLWLMIVIVAAVQIGFTAQLFWDGHKRKKTNDV